MSCYSSLLTLLGFPGSCFFDSIIVVMEEYFPVSKDMRIAWDLFTDSFVSSMFQDITSGSKVTIQHFTPDITRKRRRTNSELSRATSPRKNVSIVIPSLGSKVGGLEAVPRTSPHSIKSSPSANRLTARFRAFTKKKLLSSPRLPIKGDNVNSREIQSLWSQLQTHLPDVLYQLAAELKGSASFEKIPDDYYGMLNCILHNYRNDTNVDFFF